MSSELIARPTFALTRAERAVARQVGATRALAKATESRIAAKAELARKAMFAVAAISAIEGELTRMVPLAAGRLEVLGNLASLAIAEEITDWESP